MFPQTTKGTINGFLFPYPFLIETVTTKNKKLNKNKK